MEEIANSFDSAGWHLDGSFADYLVIGCTDDEFSIVAGKEAWETDDPPVFELIDHERDLTHEVQEIPTPQQARKMLLEHGLPTGEGET
jgi:hypothetical protein